MSNKKSYRTALPYFPKEDINQILSKFELILSGNGLLTKGPSVREFENKFSEFVGAKYGIAVNSGTSALEIVLKSIGIKRDDEIIIPTQTFVSSASCVVTNGGKPVFCEIDDNYLLDFEDLKSKITKKTKAIIIVHFCGLIHPNIFEIKEYLINRGIFLIEDAAHAHGAKINNTYAGNIGDFGCFSFYSTKIITTGGEGGIITVNESKYYDLCESLRSIGIDRKSSFEIYNIAGSNNRMTEFQAIMGISQLNRLQSFFEHRATIADHYKFRLKDLFDAGLISFQKYPNNVSHSYWRFLVTINTDRVTREFIKDQLLKNNIHIDWPYQPLLHLQPLFNYLKQRGLRKSEELAKMHLCLPIHMEIQISDADYIADKFLECFR